MEKRGQDKFLLRAKAGNTENHSELSRDYFENYNQAKALPQPEVQSLIARLAEKDKHILSLENLLTKALNNRSFNINACGDIGYISGVAESDISGIMNLGEIKGAVNNATAELPTTTPDQPDLKTLLGQLQIAITEDCTLSETDKATALK